jgi:branched-chain amino acid transport system permease protein
VSGSATAALFVAGLVALAALPLVAPAYVLTFMLILLMYVAMAQSWNMLSGYTGYFSLGHGLFFGFGAYGFALSLLKLGLPPLAALAVGGLVAVAAAAVVGFVLMRVRIRIGYFAILTLGLNEIVKTVIANTDAVGAASGFTLPPVPSPAVPYTLMLAVAAGAVGALLLIDRSRYGLGLRAILDDEEVAQSMGVRTARYKTGVFVLSAFFPGVAGGVIAWNWSFIDPYQAFDLLLSFNTAIMAVFGGVGTVWGPVVGAVVMSVLIETLWVNLRNFQAVVFGVLVVVIVMLAPRGVAPLLTRMLGRRRPVRA